MYRAEQNCKLYRIVDDKHISEIQKEQEGVKGTILEKFQNDPQYQKWWWCKDVKESRQQTPRGYYADGLENTNTL